MDRIMRKRYKEVLHEVIGNAFNALSDVKPADWVEENRVMTSDISPVPGMFSYDNTPYTKEIVNRLDPSDESRIVAVMKGAQIGFSAGAIEGGLGWIISQSPGNTVLLVGHDELVKSSSIKIDKLIDACGIRNLIRSNTLRKRNNKSGDTDKRKDFPGGHLKIGIANHKALRQESYKYGFIDDFESMKTDSKESGSTAELIEQRFAAYATQMKLFYISTPELKETSNIEPVYLKGDQRKYHIPCPCCGEFIILEWEIECESEDSEMAGMYWQTDDTGNLISESVGYMCYKCGDVFDDSNKMELLREGEWRPTATPVSPTYTSYHISALYAPIFMYDWEYYIRKFMQCHPQGQPRDEEAWQTFQNVVLGKTYSPIAAEMDASKLQRNCRGYEIGIVPEKQSMADGNGKIVLLTLAADVNGKMKGVAGQNVDDARLDWELVAWSEGGQSYSVQHGSIGTFITKSKDKGDDRARWTYRRGAPNSVWTEFEKLRTKPWRTDTGTSLKVLITGVDSGYLTDYVYDYVDNSNGFVFNLKGKDDNKYVSIGQDKKLYKHSLEKKNLYLVEATIVKDKLSEHMQLNWDSKLDSSQPYGYMNFPDPSNGLYKLSNYFSHYEAEEKVVTKDGKYKWRKTSRNSENHLFDCRIYNMAIRDIFVDQVLKEAKIINGVWSDFAALIAKYRR